MVIYSLMTTFKNLYIAPVICDTFWKVACENISLKFSCYIKELCMTILLKNLIVCCI